MTAHDPDNEWTTAEVAVHLGINPRKVAQTMTRWGVQPLPHLRPAGPRGSTRLYRAADVIQAKANAPGRGNRTKETAMRNHEPATAPALNTDGLDQADRALVWVLVRVLATNPLGLTQDEMLTDLDATQGRDGWTFDSGRGPDATGWRRYTNYRAKNWRAVRGEAVRLANDPRITNVL